MLQNRLIVTKRSDKEKIYENSKDKWIIELDGDKINNWDDFYDIMQKKIDVVDYNSHYGRNGHTYDDFATDIELFNEIKKRKVKGIVIVLDYADKFVKISEEEKGYIYFDIIFTLLLEWYRDLRIVYKQEKPTIDIEAYVLLSDDLLKTIPDYKNELIIGIENDRKEIDGEFKDYHLIELEALFETDMEHLKELREVKIDEELISEIIREEKNNLFLKKMEEKIKNNIYQKIKVLILNSDNLRFTDRRSILVDIVENVLIKEYGEGKEAKIYMIFSNEIL